MIRVLFVCHGNICRSPISEFVMKDMVTKRGIKANFTLRLQPPVQRKSGMESGIRFIRRQSGNWQSMGFPARGKERYRSPKQIMENMIIFWEWKRETFGISCEL